MTEIGYSSGDYEYTGAAGSQRRLRKLHEAALATRRARSGEELSAAPAPRHQPGPEDALTRLAAGIKARRRQPEPPGSEPDPRGLIAALRVADDPAAIASLLRNPDRIDGATGVVGLTD